MRSMRMSVLALLCAALTACSDGAADAPSTLPTLTPTTRTDSTSTSPATDINAPTPQGAADFARYWYAEITRAWKDLDPEVVARLSAPGCKACRRYVDSIREARDQNQRVEGVLFDLTLVEAQALAGGTVKVTVIYDAPTTRGFDSFGNQVRSEPAVRNFEEELTLVRSGNAWLVQEDAAV